MQKYKQAAINITFLTIILSAGICAGNLNITNDENDEKKSEKITILESFEENNYEIWKKVVGKETGIDKIVSKNDFQEFIKARNAARNAKYNKAIQISKKLESKLKNKLGLKYFS